MDHDPQIDYDLPRMRGAGLSVTTTAWLFGLTENHIRYLISIDQFPSVRSGARIFVEPRFVMEELLMNPAYENRRQMALVQLELVMRGEILPPTRGDTSKLPPGLNHYRKAAPHLRNRR